MLGIVEDGMRSVIEARKGEEEAMLTGEKVCNIMMTQTRVEEDQQEYEQIEKDKVELYVYVIIQVEHNNYYPNLNYTFLLR